MAEEAKPGTSFEEGVLELEEVVRQLETGDQPLEKALALFERGVSLSDACRKQLDDAETRVEMLLKKGDRVQAEPFPREQEGG